MANNDENTSSTLDRGVDLEQLRNGGPTETPGMLTTTGGTAGPASVAALRAQAARDGQSDGPATGDPDSGPDGAFDDAEADAADRH